MMADNISLRQDCFESALRGASRQSASPPSTPRQPPSSVSISFYLPILLFSGASNSPVD